ncbi:hypothetical protein LSTR_LSTR011829 [Laodelphax striatellus]|uniref:CCZ1/INTU/HSP4 first Longin domain-containing protein n=1 Tax=Laodelphax striatellus TaxID=195883 RepID=A0A482WW79_LAOST|nr:hypothetical protein LSTR_LSTR011829 [Laodelphax striatellus]
MPKKRISDKRRLSWLRDAKNIRSMYCELIQIKGLRRKNDVFDFQNVEIRELLIVFVYDSEKCKHEADDPQSAILYFYPSWVNDAQRLVLCGQLMGITQCMKNMFSPPSIISLQSGKFSVKIFGHYVLCVGTDRNIPDCVLETRANLLNRLLEFYHSDLLKVSNETGDSFPEKLSRIFEIYLPIMMFGGNYFSTIPLLNLPKSGSTAFLICSQILQYCQKTSGMLGGAVLYQNKVVISQISPEFTRLIVLSDPYRIKVPADPVGISFRLPVGMQLFKVYITKKQYSELKNQSMGLISALGSVPQWRENLLKDDLPPVKSLLKRDVSRIFTVVEEDDDKETLETHNFVPQLPSKGSLAEETLRSHDSKPSTEEPSTKLALSDDPLKGADSKLTEDALKGVESKLTLSEATLRSGAVDQSSSVVPDVVRDAVQARWTSRLNALPPATFVVPDVTDSLRPHYATTDNIPPTKSIRTVMPVSLGLPKMNEEWMDRDKSNGECDEMKPYYNTISDPLNPFFRSNGLPASRYLYLERVTNQLRDLHTNASDEDSDKTSSATKPLQQVKLKDVPEKKPELKLEKPSRNEKMKRNFSLPLANTTCSDTGTASLSEVRFSKNQGIPLTPLMSKLSILAEEQKKQSHFENERKISPVLSLPSRIDEDCSKVEEMVDLSKSDKFTKDFTELTSRSRKISDRELSKNTESLDIVKSSVASSSKAKRKSNSRTNRSECIDENGTGDDKELVEVVLCVLGRLSTCLVLFLEVPFSKNPDNIHDLWKSCTSKLTDLDGQFHRLLDQAPTSGMSAADSYSYMCLEPDWGTTRRDGSWTLNQLELLTRLHHDFQHAPSLTDVVVRCDDSLVYGNQCGRKEVFYQQSVSGNSLVGLPNPSDLMGIVPLKAKRRLERDHNIILL